MNSPYHKTGETVISKVFCRDSTWYPKLISLQCCFEQRCCFLFSTYKISMCYLNIGLKCKQNNFNNHFIFIISKGRLFLTSPRQVIEWLEWDIWYLDFLPYVYYKKKKKKTQPTIKHYKVKWANSILCFTTLSYMDLTILIKM